MKIYDEILEVIRTVPGLTRRELCEYVSHIKYGSVSGCLSSMIARGDVRAEEVGRLPGEAGRKRHRYFIGDGTPRSKPPHLKTPTHAATEYSLAAARSEIAELQAWKAEAIKRFPDLTVSLAVVRARLLLANAFRRRGDKGKAADATSGKLDSSIALEAIVAALEAA